MSLVRFDFDYDQAFLWRAENTEASLVYTEANLSVDQAFINRDISRVFVYPKNKHSNDTSKHFFGAWTHVRLPFSYKQGDMDGGSFIQHFWNYVALKKDINLMHMDLNLSLRFGYVNDEGKRCSCVIMYHLNDPSKWMACVTQDTEKKSFTERRASLFIPKYFSDELNGELKSNQNAQRFSDSEVHDQFIKTLGSALLIKPFQSFFDSKGSVNIKNIQKFGKKELKKLGHRYTTVLDQDESPPLLSIPKNTMFDVFGVATGGAVGWFAGVFFVGPLLAVPTLGLSLILAPAVCVLIGAVIGMLVSSVMSRCFCKRSYLSVAPAQEPQADSAKEPSIGGGSNKQMAKRGIQSEPGSFIAPDSSEVKQQEPETSDMSLHKAQESDMVQSRSAILSRL